MPPAGRWTVRLAAAATGDFRTILQWTARRFGDHRQARLYAETLQDALKALVEGPSAIGCRPRDDIAPGIFTLHVARQGRRGRHFILFRVSRETGGNFVDVLRLLHDAMDLRQHLPPSPDDPDGP